MEIALEALRYTIGKLRPEHANAHNIALLLARPTEEVEHVLTRLHVAGHLTRTPCPGRVDSTWHDCWAVTAPAETSARA